MLKIAFILPICAITQASVIPAPVLPYGNDSIKTSDGFQCSSAVAPSSYIDAGIYQEEADRYDETDQGVYVRVLIPLYSGVKRLDCSKLYEQALKERERDKVLSGIRNDVFNN